jgi:hypothetical protein
VALPARSCSNFQVLRVDGISQALGARRAKTGAATLDDAVIALIAQERAA